MMREASALLCMARHESEIDLRLKVVELKLHTPEPWNHVGRDLLPKVAHADGAPSEHAEEGTHKEDQDHHESLLDVAQAQRQYALCQDRLGRFQTAIWLFDSWPSDWYRTAPCRSYGTRVLPAAAAAAGRDVVMFRPLWFSVDDSELSSAKHARRPA
jgi:hypothetical protein